ncbi:MAG: metal ABC transporter ATP-binding protein [Spirochaetaceae bacterium]|jgi:zinc transport system ATP-binding protein|nr:metal ABC transporter ATP-binding protein [Spirochaetaceae bacterium]
MLIVLCKHISFAYDAAIVLRDISFSVEQGDYLCIVGENGSGKSTLVKGLLGLMPPVQGTIMMNNIRPHDIGFLPQQKAVQKDFPAGVFEVVLSGRLSSRGIRPFYNREDKGIAEENLKRLGIEDLRSRSYRELSGGQQQRVLIARALCTSPKLLILDEPAAGLDPVVTADLYRLLSALNHEYGLTIIMVSHDISGAMSFANRILHLNHEQLFFGSIEEYRYSEPGKQFLYGGNND